MEDDQNNYSLLNPKRMRFHSPVDIQNEYQQSHKVSINQEQGGAEGSQNQGLPYVLDTEQSSVHEACPVEIEDVSDGGSNQWTIEDSNDSNLLQPVAQGHEQSATDIIEIKDDSNSSKESAIHKEPVNEKNNEASELQITNPNKSKAIYVTNIPLKWNKNQILKYIKRNTRTNKEIIESVVDVTIEEKDGFNASYVVFSSNVAAETAMQLLMALKVKVLGVMFKYAWSSLPEHWDVQLSALRFKLRRYIQAVDEARSVSSGHQSDHSTIEDDEVAYYSVKVKNPNKSKAISISHIPLDWDKKDIKKFIKRNTNKRIKGKIVKVDITTKDIDNSLTSCVEFTSHVIAEKAMKMLKVSNVTVDGEYLEYNWSSRPVHLTDYKIMSKEGSTTPVVDNVCHTLIFHGVPKTWNVSDIKEYIKVNTNEFQYIYEENLHFVYLATVKKKFTGSCIVRFHSSRSCMKAFRLLREVPLLPTHDGIFVKMDAMFAKYSYTLKNGEPNRAELKIRMFKRNTRPTQEKNPNINRHQPVVPSYISPIYPPYVSPISQSSVSPISQSYVSPIPPAYASPVASSYVSPVSFPTQPSGLKWKTRQREKQLLSETWSEEFLNAIEKMRYDNISETYGLRHQYLNKLGVRTPISSTIFVYNVKNKYTNDEEIRNVFGHAGYIQSTEVCRYQVYNGLYKISVTYDHPVEAVQAVAMFNNQQLCGKTLKVIIDSNVTFRQPVPQDLKAFGPGLGPNGAPLTNVRSTIDFLKVKAMVSNEMQKRYGNGRREYPQTPRDQGFTRTREDAQGRVKCTYCKSTGHKIDKCESFVSINVWSRRRFARALELCHTCLGRHSLHYCPNPSLCANCGKRHMDVLCSVECQAGPPTGASQRETPTKEARSRNERQEFQKNQDSPRTSLTASEKNRKANLLAALKTMLSLQSNPLINRVVKPPAMQNVVSCISRNNLGSNEKAPNSSEDPGNPRAASVRKAGNNLNSQIMQKTQTGPNSPDKRTNLASTKKSIELFFDKVNKKQKERHRAVVISYLPPSFDLKEFEKKLSVIGEVKSLEMIDDDRAKVVFYSSRAAHECVDTFDKTLIDGYTIDVSL